MKDSSAGIQKNNHIPDQVALLLFLKQKDFKNSTKLALILSH